MNTCMYLSSIDIYIDVYDWIKKTPIIIHMFIMNTSIIGLSSIFFSAANKCDPVAESARAVTSRALIQPGLDAQALMAELQTRRSGRSRLNGWIWYHSNVYSNKLYYNYIYMYIVIHCNSIPILNNVL